MKFSLILLAFFCSFNAYAGERALTKIERIAIERSVKERLKDPDSAKFKHSKLVQTKKEGNIYCGLVNAKNSFGGYTGFQPFQTYVAVGTLGKTVAYTFSLENSDVILQLCAENGYIF